MNIHPPKAKHFRREQQKNGGYNMVPAYTEEEVIQVHNNLLEQAIKIVTHSNNFIDAQNDLHNLWMTPHE